MARSVTLLCSLSFNPRAPCGARRTDAKTDSKDCMFQSTRPVWGATPPFSFMRRGFFGFNPRAPCGARPVMRATKLMSDAFQSTRPVWGATTSSICRLGHRDVSIHAPRVGRDCLTLNIVAPFLVSIHAPRVGRDSVHRKSRPWFRVSIHAPRVGRDHAFPSPQDPSNVSIHAPRVGRDQASHGLISATSKFQSTRPVWGATTLLAEQEISAKFQSTRPVWGATTSRQ